MLGWQHCVVVKSMYSGASQPGFKSIYLLAGDFQSVKLLYAPNSSSIKRVSLLYQPHKVNVRSKRIYVWTVPGRVLYKCQLLLFANTLILNMFIRDDDQQCLLALQQAADWMWHVTGIVKLQVLGNQNKGTYLEELILRPTQTLDGDLEVEKEVRYRKSIS